MTSLTFCLFYKYGHCKYSVNCRQFHVKETFQEESCKRDQCLKRHHHNTNTTFLTNDASLATTVLSHTILMIFPLIATICKILEQNQRKRFRNKSLTRESWKCEGSKFDYWKWNKSCAWESDRQYVLSLALYVYSLQ